MLDFSSTLLIICWRVGSAENTLHKFFFTKKNLWPIYFFIKKFDIINNHRNLAAKIASRIRVIGEFEKYLKKGYYPFFMECSEITYAQRVERLVLSAIGIDIPAITPIEYDTQLKLKKLLVVLAEQMPFVPNMTTLSRDIEVTHKSQTSPTVMWWQMILSAESVTKYPCGC